MVNYESEREIERSGWGLGLRKILGVIVESVDGIRWLVQVVVAEGGTIRELLETFRCDVCESVWERNGATGEIGDDAERSHGSVEDGTVKFTKNIGSASIARNHDERTKVPRLHLAIESLLDSGVSDEHERSAGEVEVLDGMRVVLLEPSGSLFP